MCVAGGERLHWAEGDCRWLAERQQRWKERESAWAVRGWNTPAVGVLGPSLFLQVPLQVPLQVLPRTLLPVAGRPRLQPAPRPPDSIGQLLRPLQTKFPSPIPQFSVVHQTRLLTFCSSQPPLLRNKWTQHGNGCNTTPAPGEPGSCARALAECVGCPASLLPDRSAAAARELRVY